MQWEGCARALRVWPTCPLGRVLVGSVLWGGGGSVPVAASLHFHAVLFPFVLYVFFIVYQGGNWVSSCSSWIFWVLPWSSEKQLSNLCPLYLGFPSLPVISCQSQWKDI